MPRTDSVDPTTLALPSPSASPSPSPSTSSLPPIAAITNAGPSKRSSHSIVENAPPRKRSRTELTPEERKEARAHRNRIAAQNSRDKRKAQFATLEARISELTAENRALREGMGLAALRESAEQKAAEDARERENRELRERVKTLESGWDAIVKALQTHGLPSGIPSITVPKSDEKQASSSTTPSSPDTQSTSSDATSSRITTAFPVLVPSTPVFPLSPSPTLSYASASPSPYDEHECEQHESTRHLAAGGLPELNLNFNMAGFEGLFKLDAPAPDSASSPADVDEQVMDDLFREILAPSPLLSTAPLPSTDASPTLSTREGISGMHQVSDGLLGEVWTVDLDAMEAEKEMQRLLDSLPADGAGLGLGLPQLDIPAVLEFEFDNDMNVDLSWERASAQVF